MTLGQSCAAKDSIASIAHHPRYLYIYLSYLLYLADKKLPRQHHRMASEKKDDSTQPAETDPSLPEPPAIHPSFIQVAKPYIFEQTIQKCIAAMGVNPLREEALRLQGVTWIDNVRRALYLYV